MTDATTGMDNNIVNVFFFYITLIFCIMYFCACIENIKSILGLVIRQNIKEVSIKRDDFYGIDNNIKISTTIKSYSVPS